MFPNALRMGVGWLVLLVLTGSDVSAQPVPDCDPVQIWEELFHGQNGNDAVTTRSAFAGDNPQVTIEVRFLSVSDVFIDAFKRIGVDFDVDIADSAPCPTPPINDDPTFVFPDPNFGNSGVVNPLIPVFPFTFVNPHGTTFGTAILTDIEAFFFLKAALFAPKVTLFNGQAAKVADPFRPTVFFGLIVVGGTTLTIEPVVSDDLQHVRLKLMPSLAGFAPAQDFDAVGGQPQPVAGTPGTVPLPVIHPTNVGTTVTVPDGGTVLLGGLKQLGGPAANPLAEFLGNVPGFPIINRLFKNATSDHTQSLMIMVTPRIIIQEEEEA